MAQRCSGTGTIHIVKVKQMRRLVKPTHTSIFTWDRHLLVTLELLVWGLRGSVDSFLPTTYCFGAQFYEGNRKGFQMHQSILRPWILLFVVCPQRLLRASLGRVGRCHCLLLFPAFGWRRLKTKTKRCSGRSGQKTKDVYSQFGYLENRKS